MTTWFIKARGSLRLHIVILYVPDVHKLDDKYYRLKWIKKLFVIFICVTIESNKNIGKYVKLENIGSSYNSYYLYLIYFLEGVRDGDEFVKCNQLWELSVSKILIEDNLVI